MLERNGSLSEMEGLQQLPTNPPISGEAIGIGGGGSSGEAVAADVHIAEGNGTESRGGRRKRMSIQDNLYASAISHPDTHETYDAELPVNLHDESVEIIHEGFMSKRGYYRRNFLKRWFVAYGKSKNYMLEYYDVKGGRLKGSIELLDYYVADANPSEPRTLVAIFYRPPLPFLR